MCDHQWAPFDLLTSEVGTAEPLTIDPDNLDVDADDFAYEPTGYTHIHWDSQTTVGVVCSDCGKAVVDREAFDRAVAFLF